MSTITVPFSASDLIDASMRDLRLGIEPYVKSAICAISPRLKENALVALAIFQYELRCRNQHALVIFSSDSMRYFKVITSDAQFYISNGVDRPGLIYTPTVKYDQLCSINHGLGIFDTQQSAEETIVRVKRALFDRNTFIVQSSEWRTCSSPTTYTKMIL